MIVGGHYDRFHLIMILQLSEEYLYVFGEQAERCLDNLDTSPDI